MKRHGNLYDIISSKDNIRAAIIDAAKRKSQRREVIEVVENLDKYIDELHCVLTDQSFRNSEYHTFEVNAKGKIRLIYKLPFYPDRVLHHCIVRVLQPIWMKQMIRDTYSSIPGRGVHDGVNRIKSALKDREATRYCLKIDISKFYPSVDHDDLKNELCRSFKDARLLRLLYEIIDSAPGLPIGNYLSQWLGNIYLNRFDHYMKEVMQVRYYFRYCDDIVILHADKAYLHALLVNISDYIEQNLHLSVKRNYQVFPVDDRGIDFLGYRFFHGYTLVRKRIVKEFKHKLKTLTGVRLKQSLASYKGWFIHADTRRLTLKYQLK